MRRALTVTASAAAIATCLGAPAVALAQPTGEQEAAVAPVPTGPADRAPAIDTAQRGVLVFEPAFFADQRPNTALDMANRVPGFRIDDGAQTRGFEGAVGNVLINGARPASKNDAGSSVLGRTVASRVERIELIRGGAPGIDMQGYAAVINVILKSTSSREHILTGNAFFFDGGTDLYGGSYQFTATEADRTWGVTLSDGVSMSDSNGEGRSIRRRADGTILRDEAFYNDNYGGSTGIRGNYSGPLMGGKIDATARLGVNDFHDFMSLQAPDVYRESGFDEEGHSGELGLTYSRTLNPRWTAEGRLIHEFGSFDNESYAFDTLDGTTGPLQQFTAEGDVSETILRGTLRNERSPKLTLEIGAEVAYNMLDVAQAFTIDGEDIPLPSATVKVEETRGEVFSKATWRLHPDLTLEGGLRFEASTISQSGDADQEKSLTYLKPRFQATWTPGQDNQFRFRFEREVGQLDFGDFAASAELGDDNVYGGNVNLEPEQRWISEVTYERRFWGEGVVTIGYRHDEIIDVIDRLPLPEGLSAVGNIGDGTLDQLSLNVVVPLDKLGFTGGRFTFRNDWNKTEVTDPTTGETRPISGVRPRQAVIGLSQDIASWKTNWGVAWIPRLGQATYDPDQTFAWSGEDYFELFAEYKPTDSLSIRAQVNLWDTFDIERTVFEGRETRDILFVEERFIDPRTFWQIRVRKTF